jgi:hypothetical protein
MAPAVAGFYLSYPDPAHARAACPVCLCPPAIATFEALVQYCAVAQSRFEQCDDFASERQFLLDYVEKIVLSSDDITIFGRAPLVEPWGDNRALVSACSTSRN